MLNIRNFVGIVDIFIILLFIVMIYRGWTKGILDLLVRFFARFFGVAFASLFAFPLSLILGPLFLYSWFEQEAISSFFFDTLSLGYFTSHFLSSLLSATGPIITSFLFILLGVPILSLIGRSIINFFRQYKSVRYVDGFLGIFGMFFIYFIVLFVVFFIFRIMIDTNAFSNFSEFLVSDMRLETNHFSISRFLFNNSILDFFFLLIVS